MTPLHFDLHTHSTYSDGSNSPEEIIRKGKAIGLNTIALTDHDTIDGINEAQQIGNQLNVNFIPGIELSSRYGTHGLLHILGLGLNITSSDFLTLYTTYKKNRENAIPYVLKALKDKGIDLTIRELAPYQKGAYADRHTIAHYLLANQHRSTLAQIWIEILDTIPYSSKELLDVSESIQMIHAGQGKAFLAHIHKKIGLCSFSEQEKFQHLKHLKNLGLDGIESLYPSYTEEDKDFIQKTCITLGFLQSGGSDYHGKHRPNIALGQIN